VLSQWAGSHLKAAVKELLSLSWQFCSQIWGAEKQLEQQGCWIGKTKYVHGQNFHMVCNSFHCVMHSLAIFQECEAHIKRLDACIIDMAHLALT